MLIGTFDGAEQMAESLAIIALAQLVRSGGHAIFLGHERQLTPTVVSEKASNLELTVSEMKASFGDAPALMSS